MAGWTWRPSVMLAGDNDPGRVSAVYLIVYDFPDMNGIHTWFEIYGGTTIDFPRRSRGHIDNTNKGNNAAHYRTARRATAPKMFPICIIDGKSSEARFLCLVMEQ